MPMHLRLLLELELEVIKTDAAPPRRDVNDVHHREHLAASPRDRELLLGRREAIGLMHRSLERAEARRELTQRATANELLDRRPHHNKHIKIEPLQKHK